MRIKRFDFIDENFGEKVECILIWNDNSFILITAFENKIHIKEYKEITDLLKEMITNTHELEINKDFLIDQDMKMIELEREIEMLKSKLKKSKNERGNK